MADGVWSFIGLMMDCIQTAVERNGLRHMVGLIGGCRQVLVVRASVHPQCNLYLDVTGGMEPCRIVSRVLMHPVRCTF